MAKSQTYRRHRREKALIFLALAAPMIVSSVLVARTASGLYFDSASTRWIEDNRAAVQIIVQILSTILGACQIKAIGSAMAMSKNIEMQSRPISLDNLKLWNALHLGKFDFDLPLKPMIVLALYVIAIQLPSALWAGAITPTTAIVNVTADVVIPNYSQSTVGLWGQQYRPAADGSLSSNTSDLGTFTYLPWKGQYSAARIHFLYDNANFI
jgi:hypothetical protein